MSSLVAAWLATRDGRDWVKRNFRPVSATLYSLKEDNEYGSGWESGQPMHWHPPRPETETERAYRTESAYRALRERMHQW
jgi:hypothetical protein